MGIATNQSLPQAEICSAAETVGGPRHVERVDLFIFTLVGIVAATSWARIIPRINGIDVLAVTAVIGGGYPVFREALENLLARRMTMELSMTIALAAALAIREFSTALFILFFVLGAEILEGLTVDRGRQAIQDLSCFLPKKGADPNHGRI